MICNIFYDTSPDKCESASRPFKHTENVLGVGGTFSKCCVSIQYHYENLGTLVLAHCAVVGSGGISRGAGGGGW